MAVTRRPGRRTGRDAQASGGVKKATFDTSRKKEVGVSDLTLLSKVSDESILENLKIRFQAGLIYTYIGHVLISVNPFRDLGIYTEQVLESYQGKNRLEVPPHVFAIAESMYYNMKSYDENQCVIISGESGAGKTEAAKRIMQYIAAVSGQSTSSITKIKDMVLATNPLLEAFGCAKTLRNDNSSRHGKYLEILFNGQSEPVGAHITNYLLEKNRVVGQIRGERGFHIFYQFTKGAPQRYREMFGVQTPDVYAYTSRSQCTSVNGIDDVKEFQETIKVMEVIGMTQQEQDNIFKMLAAILWIGNVTFIEADDSTTSIADTSVTNFAAYLLGVDGQSLEQALTHRLIESGFGHSAETFESTLNKVQALAVRDALAKAIYSNLFDWIVARVNTSLVTQGESKKSIGILDIYGFEIFEHNSFEQICINYVNEKLQQIFIQLTLKTEQDEYVAEQIQWTPIDYFNNKIVCDLIEEVRPPGVFAVLNDACATAHADSSAADQSFGMKLNMLTSNPHLQMRADKFIVKHYAGDVTYDIDNMTDKNKDQIGKSLTRLLAATQDPFLAGLFPEAFQQDDDSAASRRRRRITASDRIKQSANKLMDTLAQSRPSYIRTIKPNQNRSPTEFEANAVLHQVKYLGLKENVRIRRAGFASRQPFEKFVERFYLLSSKTGYAGDYIWQGSERDATLEILKAAGIPSSEWQMGVSKIFIKTPETLFALEHMRDMYWHKMAARIQRAWRRHFKRRMEAILVIQHACKSYLGIAQEPKLPPPDDRFLGGKKQRRRFSLLGERTGYGDYLVCNDPNSAGGYLIQSVGIKGPVIFSGRGDQLFSKLGRSSQRLTRTFILTPTTFYTVRGDVEQGRLIYTIERTVAVNAIVGIAMSTLRDDWFAIETSSKETSDLLLWTPLKTELISLLNRPVTISPQISYHKKPKKSAVVKFVQDTTSGNFDTYKSGTIHVGPGGLPGNSPREEVPKRKKIVRNPAGARPAAAARPAQSQPRPAQPRPAQPQQRQQPAQTSQFAGFDGAHAAAQQPRAQPQAHATPQAPQAPQARQAQPRAAPPPPPPPPAAPAKPTYKAMYDFPGTNAGELGVTAGEVITVEQDSGNGWSLGVNSAGKTGWVPTAYIEKQAAGGANLASGLAAALNQQQQQGHAMATNLANVLRQQ